MVQLEVHQRALRCLEASGQKSWVSENLKWGARLEKDWSGPYAAEEGEYWYNHRLKVSRLDASVSVSLSAIPAT